MTEKITKYDADYDERVRVATDMWSSVLQTKHVMVAKRRSLGLSQQDVADALGMSLKKVRKFESYDDDPKMSTILSYALLVGQKDGFGVYLRVEDVDHPTA